MLNTFIQWDKGYFLMLVVRVCVGGGGGCDGGSIMPQLRKKQQRPTFNISHKNSLIADVKAIMQQRR